MAPELNERLLPANALCLLEIPYRSWQTPLIVYHRSALHLSVVPPSLTALHVEPGGVGAGGVGAGGVGGAGGLGAGHSDLTQLSQSS